ncbi:MAG: ABC transporter ATP-binding protein [Clostridia bacterium]|nr:ABC transporter ATP-binding protein [Clostridia bacterium]
MEQVTQKRGRGTLGWIAMFAGRRKGSYIASVILAVLNVICGFIPFIYLANITKGLLEKTADFCYCLTQCLWMAVFFVLSRLFHAFSTTLSHRATFEVLANVRRMLTGKLARMPLGDVLDESSGTYKNIIVERVDSIETTLAHMIPELTSNIIIPFVIFGYMLSIDWRLALLSLITVPVGAVCFGLMMRGSNESYQNTIVKTKALNDTAVEYINGIEVIKAFGKSKTSYEKFIVAAREGANCFIDWMRRCNVYQNLALAIMPAKRDIELKNVDFSYDRRKIIDNVSLTIPEKTTTAFVGPSGGGKTTLCHLMARFWDVQGGKVLLGGRNVKDYSFDSLMKNFSFVFQNVYLFEDTIANNIRFGEPEASMDRVIEAAKKARCHDFIMALPEGYQTVIGEGGASLSGGEKQRISIARAIMKDAPVIILDEATANVDPENEAELTAAIEELTKEKTIIMIAHRLKTVHHADQIFVVDNGKIVQHGMHGELIREKGIYRTFVEGRQEAASWKLSQAGA